MVIERTKKEIIFKLPAGMDTLVLQRVIDYLNFREATKDSKGTDEQANKLAKESKKRWWSENKQRFIK
jgi:hypothetical protein